MNATVIFEKSAYAGVMQDKVPPGRLTTSLAEPSTAEREPVYRPKHHGSEKRQTRLLSTRVPFALGSAVDRYAKEHHWTISKSVCVLLDASLQYDLAAQFGTKLAAVVVDAVKQQVQKDTSRSATLALQAYYAAEQTRILTINTLRFLLDTEIDELPLMISEAQKQAWANLKRVVGEQEAPDLAGMKQGVQSWQS
jgi:hypothetical protein